MNYKEAKKQGYKYITRDAIGGECAHKEYPKKKHIYWYSKGWHYIDNGYACKSKDEVIDIDTAIKTKKPQEPIRPINPFVYVKVCSICNKVFETLNNRQKYCGKECANVESARRHKERQKEQRRLLSEYEQEIKKLRDCLRNGNHEH